MEAEQNTEDHHQSPPPPPSPHHQHHHRQIRQSRKPSYGYGTNSMAPKCTMTQPAFGSLDNLLDTKCELNNDNNKNATNTNTECGGVIETSVYYRHPLHNSIAVDATNRTASGLMTEKELFKCKNAKYSQIISKRDIVLGFQSNQIPGKDEQIKSNIQRNSADLRTMTEISTQNGQAKKKHTKLLIPYRSEKSTNTLISRISDELNRAPVETFHKTLDFGEQLFIEKFLALETNI